MEMNEGFSGDSELEGVFFMMGLCCGGVFYNLLCGKFLELIKAMSFIC